MKKIFTLCLVACIVIVSRSQAVLNEVYPGIISSAVAGGQDITLPTNDDPVIIVVKSASGRHELIIPVDVFLAPPIHLMSFQGNINKANKITLQWTIADNETVDQFEVQRSYDGIEFKTIGIVFSSEKKDTEEYMFYETIGNFDKVMYRLKMIGKGKEMDYSKILAFQPNLTSNQNNTKVIGKPGNEKLSLNYARLK